MGWKEFWEKHQVAATFAEAGEEEMAREFLEEDRNQKQSPGKIDGTSPAAGKGLLKPSHAEG